MEVDEIEAGLLEKFSSLQTVDQPGAKMGRVARFFLIQCTKIWYENIPSGNPGHESAIVTFSLFFPKLALGKM
jgi:hypothetical protein